MTSGSNHTMLEILKDLLILWLLVKTHPAIISLFNQKKEKQRTSQKRRRDEQNAADPHLQKNKSPVKVPLRDHPNPMTVCRQEVVSSAMKMKMAVKWKISL
jgi:hypothetical protein